MIENSYLTRFNNGLLDIRETFYKTGRLDNSNTKLDEISKLLCLEVASAHKKTEIPSLKEILDRHKSPNGIIREINSALLKASQLDIFLNANGESLFGSDVRLSLSESEGEVAQKLVKLIVETFNGHFKAVNTSENFELINECFGHFIRDNFRNNIEDAQYMTPPEVVNFICELAIDEVINQNSLVNKKRDLVVCDPSCGVGSFLAQFYKLLLHTDSSKNMKVSLIGQDKVDRMARLANLNLLLFGAKNSTITRGNSLLTGSVLDSYLNTCDLILTNPPFGARFHTTELAFHSNKFFPYLNNFIQTTDSNIDSELLFLDRYISLLRPGGSVFVVVPDAIISASGLPKLMREYLAKECTIVSITELPAVTFAQAGTRTKTCVLHLKKQSPNPKQHVFFSCVKSLGFEVASRKGVPYKRVEGENELPKVVQSIRSQYQNANGSKTKIFLLNPSCVSTSYSKLIEESWTPNHHSAVRYSTLLELDEKKAKDGTELVKLGDAVIMPNQYKQNGKKSFDSKCISVLHVGDFGSLNIKELMEYLPKYPGQPCSPGDILFSKINPRIPRALVVPDLGFQLSCSTEFAVMRAKDPFTPYEIMALLLTASAQSQIQSLTSGTSSSHNRIKTEHFLNILLPIPNKKRRIGLKYNQSIDNFKTGHEQLIQASINLYEQWREINKL